MEATDEAMLRLGMPMAPSVLLQLVGPKVANHVLHTLHDAFPDRFRLSATLAAIAEGAEEPVVVEERPSSPNEVQQAVLEALACGRPALTCNEAFIDFFGPDRERYLFRPGDDAALANRLAEVLISDPATRGKQALALRARVVAEHSVDHLADELVALLG